MYRNRNRNENETEYLVIVIVIVHVRHHEDLVVKVTALFPALGLRPDSFASGLIASDRPWSSLGKWCASSTGLVGQRYAFET